MTAHMVCAMAGEGVEWTSSKDMSARWAAGKHNDMIRFDEFLYGYG